MFKMSFLYTFYSSAVITLMGDESKITKDGADESYELRYNSGCSMAAIGEYTEVSIHLIIYLSMNTDTTLGAVWLL